GDGLVLAAQGQVDLEGVVDRRHGVGRELDVHDRADDPRDATDRAGGLGLFNSGSHLSHFSASQSWPALASARALTPPTISLISWVMPAWRAWLAIRVYFLISSSALSVADFIAFCRAASSEAAACSRQK